MAMNIDPTASLPILVFDDTRNEWRGFRVVPADPYFRAACGNKLHQFNVLAPTCACGMYARLRTARDAQAN